MQTSVEISRWMVSISPRCAAKNRLSSTFNVAFSISGVLTGLFDSLNPTFTYYFLTQRMEATSVQFTVGKLDAGMGILLLT